MSEVCNTSSKCWLPNNSANKVLLHTKTYTSPSFKRKNLHSPLQNLLETSTFSTCRLVFTVDEVCYILNKYQPPNNLEKYQYFYTRNLYPSFISKKIGAVHCKHFSEHSIFQMNSDFLINHFMLHLIRLLHSNKKFVLSIAQVFRNIYFLPHANKSSQWIRCAIFQIETDLLVIYQNINIFTQETSHPSFILK